MSSADACFLASLGLSSQKIEETLKNSSVTQKLTSAVVYANKSKKNEELDKRTGTLLYHLITHLKSQVEGRRDFLIDYVLDERIRSQDQITAAIDYFLAHHKDTIDLAGFEASCGVGVVVSSEDVEEAVEQCIQKYRTDIESRRYRYNTGPLMGEVKRMLKWADPKSIKSEIEVQMFDLLGPKTVADKESPSVDKGKKQVKAKTATLPEKGSKKEEATSSASYVGADGGVQSFYQVLGGEAMKFHKTGENYKTANYVMTPNTMKHMADHLKITGGQVRTRFPPEPNGVLHIGHAKAINFNFGYAKANDGVTYLRYDDTNPAKEEERFFKAIHEMVLWLGYTPWKVTHASDNFQQLYELATDLIKRDLAYVCHQKTEDLRGMNVPHSPWRDRPIEESLALFVDMKNGKLAEGAATLRMKHVLEDGKKDPVCYRIKFLPHNRTGDEWCIYPTYDYTHCLCDSIEHISHSLCTKEFQARRSSYYWLCNAVDLYCPVQWEYGRMNINYTVVSKRKIAKLIEAKIVRDWDDPRLFTLTALRRRGVPSEAINLFCGLAGVTMSQTTLDPTMLDSCVLDVLNVNARRAMAVLDPLLLTLVDLPSDAPSYLDVPDFPAAEERGTHRVPLGNQLYIDRSDFRLDEDKGYKRLSLGQPVGLKYCGYVVTVKEVIKDAAGRVTELKVACKKASEGKPKSFIQWVCNPLSCEVRLYERLFIHKNPEDREVVPGGFLTDIAENTLQVKKKAMVDQSVRGCKELDRFQFERLGYFAVDSDSTPLKMVFNRTMTLKESKTKH